MDINKEEQVKQFFTEQVDIRMGEMISKGELYDAYIKWSHEKQIWSLGRAHFGQMINKLYGHLTPSGAFDFKTKKRVWRNIELKINP